MALAQAADVSGTLYGTKPGPAEPRRRLAGVDRLSVVADRLLLAGRWAPRGPGQGAELALPREQFAAGAGPDRRTAPRPHR